MPLPGDPWGAGPSSSTAGRGGRGTSRFHCPQPHWMGAGARQWVVQAGTAVGSLSEAQTEKSADGGGTQLRLDPPPSPAPTPGSASFF